jgi:hypothetical protein
MKSYIAAYLEQIGTEEPITVIEDTSKYHPSELSIPLTERIKRLVASLPEPERNIPKSMEYFQTRLRGRKGKAAHVGEIADALRKLGYLRKRAWSKDANGFRAYWYPYGFGFTK